MDDLETRVRILEEWRGQENTRAAVADAHFVNLSKRFDRLDLEIESLKSSMWKFLWIVLAAFVAAFAAWVFNGGMAIG